MPAMTGDEILEYMRKVFPQSGMPIEIESLEDGYLRTRIKTKERYLRPGGTISGPVMMTVADTAMYYLLIGMIGPVPLALTTNLNINFLRSPRLGDLIAEARILKLGKRLAVGEVTIRGEASEQPAAHATVTYSIPPDAITGGQAPSE